VRVSFTGTRRGMSLEQIDGVRFILGNRTVSVASHGVCSGADIQFHKAVREIFGRTAYIACFPSTAKTAAPIPDDADFVADRKPPLDRNKDILLAGPDLLIATPATDHEVVRSGTWTTIRLAKKLRMPILQVMLGGGITYLGEARE